jgi:hypothetical protein
MVEFSSVGEEVSWLGIVDRRRPPGGTNAASGFFGVTSPHTVAGAAPASHWTSLSRRACEG